jgi:hypothetical protein
MPIEIGSTFLVPTPPRYNKEHLYIVIAIKDNLALLVMLSKPSIYVEDTCYIRVGEHSSVKSDKVINYAEPLRVETEKIESLVRGGQFTPHERMAGGIIKKIIEGAKKSPLLPEWCLAFID